MLSGEAMIATLLRSGRTAPPVAVAIGRDHVGLATRDGSSREVASSVVPAREASRVLPEIERDAQPRWVWWAADATVDRLRAYPYALAPRAAWDLAAVQRLLVGGWDDGPATVWASAGPTGERR